MGSKGAKGRGAGKVWREIGSQGERVPSGGEEGAGMQGSSDPALSHVMSRMIVDALWGDRRLLSITGISEH